MSTRACVRASSPRDKKRVLRLLEQVRKPHRGPLPSELAEQVKACGGYFGRAAGEALTLIALSDQAALNESGSDTEVRALLTPFLAADRSLAVVPVGELAEVKRILVRFGVLVCDALPR